MLAPDYRVCVAFTRTGQVVDWIDQPQWSFDEKLAWGDLGTMSVTVPLPGVSRVSQGTRDTLRSIGNGGCALSLGLIRDDVALWAGPAYSLKWDDDSVTVNCASLAKIFDRRVALTAGYLAKPTATEASLTLALQPRDLAIELLRQGMTGTRRDLPVVLPDQSGNTGPAVTYAASDLKTIYEAVKDVVEADGGPDVLLQPTISSDQSQLTWGAAVGTPRLGGPNPDATWDYPVAVPSGDVDDSETVDTAYVLGDSVGSGSDIRLIGVATADRGDPWLALEGADRTSVSETRAPQLNALAASYQSEYSRPVQSMEFSAPADEVPPYRTSWNLGDVATFSITGHPWLDDGPITQRIVAVNIDADTVKFTGAAL